MYGKFKFNENDYLSNLTPRKKVHLQYILQSSENVLRYFEIE